MSHLFQGVTYVGFLRAGDPLKLEQEGYRPWVKNPKALEKDPGRGRTGAAIGLGG